MKTKIVYVLVSSSRDIYLEQAYISMYSVKYYMPDAYIILLVDKQTEETLVDVRKKETKYVDEIISVSIKGNYTPQQRSRILKTSVRKYIVGDFLFLDTDTIVVKPLSEIDYIEADIAACWDSHTTFDLNPYRSICIEHGKILQWPIEKEKIYFNSGVIYVKDNEKTHEYYELWHKNWLEGCKNKVNMDLPAFAKTNYILNHPVQTLDNVWNCELKHGVKYLKEAKIVHYLCTNISKNNDRQVFILNEKSVFLDIIANNGEIPLLIKDTIVDPFQGLSSVTHLFSGNDLFFLQSDIFLLIYRFKESLIIRGIDKLIGMCKFFIKKILR